MLESKGNLYSIEYLKKVVKEDIFRLPKNVINTIKLAIENRLTKDPLGFGRPLRYSLKGLRRLRIGDYRIVYRIDYINLIVIILAIKHRKDIYKNI